jgi:plasmid stability protein
MKRHGGHQGVFVELPADLHQRLAASAKRNCRSAGQEARMAIQEWLSSDRRTGSAPVAEVIKELARRLAE